MSDDPNPRALKILKDTYWSSKGWKSNPRTSPEDLAFATNAGIMFSPVQLNHDQGVDEVLRAVRGVSRESVAAGFLASLSTRRLDLRSALGSYAVHQHFSQHQYTPYSSADRACAVCGQPSSSNKWEDLNVLNFERFQWGGVRHDQPVYAAFDLERFATTSVPDPTVTDVAILKEIVNVAGSQSPSARPRAIVKATSKTLASNTEERRTLVSILGYAGILQPQNMPSFRHGYIALKDREETDDDWNFPAGSWRGSDGVNDEAIQIWFGEWLK